MIDKKEALRNERENAGLLNIKAEDKLAKAAADVPALKDYHSKDDEKKEDKQEAASLA